MTVESVTAAEALLNASPLVIALVSALSGWFACQRLVVKPTIERYSARLATLEARETEIMRVALRKLEAGDG